MPEPASDGGDGTPTTGPTGSASTPGGGRRAAGRSATSRSVGVDRVFSAYAAAIEGSEAELVRRLGHRLADASDPAGLRGR